MTWPFENDTSAITKKLAQRSFKANKLRNIVAVIAIVLTSMLFTSVTTLCVGAIQSIQTTILQIRGTSPSTGTSVNWIAIIAALFFIMIFVITGYLLIRNIFEISVVQEIKKYGLLRTIGTTEKQIKRIVYSVLYHRMAPETKAIQSHELIPVLLNGLETDPQCAYLREHPKFREIIDKYKNK